jgi:hypothetical protein
MLALNASTTAPALNQVSFFTEDLQGDGPCTRPGPKDGAHHAPLRAELAKPHRTKRNRPPPNIGSGRRSYPTDRTRSKGENGALNRLISRPGGAGKWGCPSLHRRSTGT